MLDVTGRHPLWLRPGDDLPAGTASTGKWWRPHSQRHPRYNCVPENHAPFPMKGCLFACPFQPGLFPFCDQLELEGHSGRSLHPTPAASLESGLPCLLLRQTFAKSQQKVEENLGDFTRHKLQRQGRSLCNYQSSKLASKPFLLRAAMLSELQFHTCSHAKAK